MSFPGAEAASREDQERRPDVDAQVRAMFGRQLTGCERLGEFVAERTVRWAGRPLEPRGADAIIAAEFGRARKTYAAVLHLVLGGFGPQAAMLNRSLFEGMAVAHWAHANPAEAWEMFEKHERHNALLWGDAFTGVGWVEPEDLPAGNAEERADLDKLFGPYGHRIWTGHRNLRDLVVEIEDQWREGWQRGQLQEFFRILHRDNNQVLHSTVTSLMRGAIDEGDAVRFDSVPSSELIDRGLFGALWCYSQTLTLLWDHFGIRHRDELDAVITDAVWPFAAIDPALAKTTGRNDPCPCGSGRKFKRCHGVR